jgi:signal transduction histidine kinase
LSELLASGRVADDLDRNEYYRALSRESERMHRLVEGLLNFGRLESGAIRYRFERLDAIEFVGSVVAEFRRDAEAHGYQVELANNGSRPVVSADRAALGCAVSNLLDNAVKYSPECSTVWVEVTQAAHHTVAIRVRDRGIGIPPRPSRNRFSRNSCAALQPRPAAYGAQGSGWPWPDRL